MRFSVLYGCEGSKCPQGLLGSSTSLFEIVEIEGALFATGGLSKPIETSRGRDNSVRCRSSSHNGDAEENVQVKRREERR